MEKTLFLTVLAVFAVLGLVSSVPSSKFLLRELIRELEDAQVDNAAPVVPTPTPSNVEAELANIGDLTGLKNNGGEGETTGEEGAPTVAQEADEGETGPTAGEGDNTGDANQGGETEGGDPTAGEDDTAGEGETGGTEQEGETAVEGPTTEEGPTAGEGETGQGGETAGEDLQDGQKTHTQGGENAEENVGGVDDEASEEGHNPNMDDGKHGIVSKLPENETPLEPIGGDEGRSPHSPPSTLEKSAVRMARLLDNLSRMLTMRADSLSRIDKVLMEGPEMGYPSTQRLAEKQETLEVMAAKVGEMKKVLSHFFDDVYDRFNNFVSDDRDDGDRIETHGPVTGSPNPMIESKPVQPEESLPEKPDSADVQQRQLLKRLLSVLRSDSKRSM